MATGRDNTSSATDQEVGGSTTSDAGPPQDDVQVAESPPKRGLSVKRKWLDLILSGQKTWEIRGTPTTKRELVGLIESVSGHVLGEARITDSLVVSPTDLRNNVDKHRIEDLSIIEYRKVHAWVLTDAKRYKEPQPYEHPQGAVVWIHLAKPQSASSPVVRIGSR